MGARRNKANLSRPREISLRSETKNPSQIDFCNFCGPSSVEVGDFSSVHLFRPILVLLANFWSFYSHISENSALKKKNILLRIQKHPPLYTMNIIIYYLKEMDWDMYLSPIIEPRLHCVRDNISIHLIFLSKTKNHERNWEIYNLIG